MQGQKVTLPLDWAPSVDAGACQHVSSTAVCRAYPSTAAGTCYEAAGRGDRELWPSLKAHLGQHNKLSARLCGLAVTTYTQLHIPFVHHYKTLLPPEQSIQMGLGQTC